MAQLRCHIPRHKFVKPFVLKRVLLAVKPGVVAVDAQKRNGCKLPTQLKAKLRHKLAALLYLPHHVLAVGNGNALMNVAANHVAQQTHIAVFALVRLPDFEDAAQILAQPLTGQLWIVAAEGRGIFRAVVKVGQAH